MATDVELVNAALTEIGQKKITSLDNTINSDVIQTAIFQLPRIKRAVLRARDWNVARRRFTLVLLATDISLGEWTYNYDLPADCLAVRRFVGTTDEEKYQKFSVEQTPAGKPVFMTNVQGAKIVYTHDLVDVNRWDPMLFDAAATRLAIEFAISFARDLKFVSALWQSFKEKMEEGVGVDEAEGGIESAYNVDMVTVRNF